jgi:hypothetical protein
MSSSFLSSGWRGFSDTLFLPTEISKLLDNINSKRIGRPFLFKHLSRSAPSRSDFLGAVLCPSRAKLLLGALGVVAPHLLG